MSAPITCGRFTLDPDTGTLTAPAQYMREQGDARLAAITAGRDAAFNMSAHLSPSIEIAILVALQTDYAAWAGAHFFFAAMEARR